MSSGIDLENRRVWANAGDVTEPSTVKQDDGYDGAEQPFNEHHNWIWNNRDIKENKKTDRLNRTHIASPGTSIADFCSNLNSRLTNDWLHPYATQNLISFGASPVVNMCRGWNYVRKQEVIYAVIRGDNTKIVEIRNADDFSIETEDHLITVDVPGLETIEAICCDGPFIYVMIENTGSAGIYKYATNPWSATKVAFLATPIDIDLTGKGKNNIIVADTSNLAFVGVNEATLAARSINIVPKTLLSVASGRGNAPSSATYFAGTGLCSDGFTCFFGVYSSAADNTLLCAGNIADPTIATGLSGSFTAQTIGAVAINPGGLIHDGRHISILRSDGYVSSFNKDIPKWRPLDFQFENTFSPDEKFPKITYDGFTAWAILQHDGDSDANNGFIAPFRPDDICLDHPTTRIIQNKIFLSTFTDGATIMEETRMEYADGCLWFNPEVLSAGGGANLFRVPNILNRRG